MKKAMKGLMAGSLIVALLATMGCGGDDKKKAPAPTPQKKTEQPVKKEAPNTGYKAPSGPKDTKGKTPDIKYTLTKLTGYEKETKDNFGAAGMALYKNHLIIANPDEKTLEAIKIEGNTALLDASMFNNGVLKLKMGSPDHPIPDTKGGFYYGNGFGADYYNGTAGMQATAPEIKLGTGGWSVVTAPEGNYAAVFHVGNNQKVYKGTIANNVITAISDWEVIKVHKNSKDNSGKGPFYQISDVKFADGLVYVMGNITEYFAKDKKGRSGSNVVVSFAPDGTQKQVYGNPDWMAGDGIKTGSRDFFVTKDYVVVIDTQSGRGISLYNKNDGKYLGTFFSEQVLQDKRAKITGVGKISDKDWYIVWCNFEKPQQNMSVRRIARMTLQ